MTPRRIAVHVVLLCLAASATAAAADPFTAIVAASIEIQQRLAADSADGAPAFAEAIASAAAALDDAGDAMRRAAADLGSARDIKAVRAAFGTLTRAILSYAGTTGAHLAADVRIAYCPMARQYWLQKGDEIRNPFYGAAMLDCGRFVAAVPTFRQPATTQAR